jgi:two-component system response regulator PilR (NtrC family)
VLVVDDEPAVRDALVRILQVHGVPAAGAGGVTEALERLASGAFEAVVTDLRLSDGSGLDLIREARRRDPALRAAVLTGYGTFETAVEALRLGAADFLSKPFRLSEVLDCLERLRARGPAAPPAPASAPAPAATRAPAERDLLWAPLGGTP